MGRLPSVVKRVILAWVFLFYFDQSGVTNCRFYAADGDDNFVTTEASANNCGHFLLDDDIGYRFILAALGYIFDVCG